MSLPNKVHSRILKADERRKKAQEAYEAVVSSVQSKCSHPFAVEAELDYQPVRKCLVCLREERLKYRSSFNPDHPGELVTGGQSQLHVSVVYKEHRFLSLRGYGPK